MFCGIRPSEKERREHIALSERKGAESIVLPERKRAARRRIVNWRQAIYEKLSHKRERENEDHKEERLYFMGRVFYGSFRACRYAF